MTSPEVFIPTPLEVKVHRVGSSMLRMTEGSAGFDLSARLETPVRLLPFEPTVIPTGVYLEMPKGLEAQVRPRSSMSRKGVLVSFGTIDSDYRGEISAVLLNLTNNSLGSEYMVNPGDRIAQLIFSQVANVKFTEVGSQNELGETKRGTGGWGSTGR